jgi:hypothetical protein
MCEGEAMTNDLKERLEALSAGATQGTWAWKETSKIDCGYVGEDDWPTVLHGAYHEGAVDECDADGLLCSTLVNAFRSGDLITRQELDEAVIAEREGCLNAVLKGSPRFGPEGPSTSEEYGESEGFRISAQAIRARSEQKGGA